MSDKHGQEKAPPLTRAYITAYRDEDALEAALAVRQSLNRIDRTIPLVVALSRDHGVARLINDTQIHQPHADLNIEVFPALEQICTTEFVLGGSFEPIAEAIHEHWRTLSRAQGNPEPESWAEVDESLRQSSRAQARHIKVKLHTIGCSVGPLSDWEATTFEFHDPDDKSESEVELLAHLEHERWIDERRAAGWKPCAPPKTIGEEKENKKQKLTPYLVAFKDLPEPIADYDREFVRAIPKILASAGFQVDRTTAPVRDDGIPAATD
jgi:hypothetical protein